MYQRQLRDLAAVLTVRAQAAAINADVHPDALMKAVAMARNARQDMLLAFGLPTTALTDVPASLSAPAVLPLGELIDRTRQAERARA